MLRRAWLMIRKRRRALGWLLALGLIAQMGVALPAGTPHGTVTLSKPLTWAFPPVGGPSSDTADFDLTVKLPRKTSKLYKPNVRTGTNYAAYLQITLRWKGTSSDDTLGLSAKDPKGHSVGNDTLAVTNNGGNVNVFMLQMPLNEKYTITAFNQVGNSSEAVASNAVARLHLVNLAKFRQPAQPAGAPQFRNYHVPLSLMPPTAEEQAIGGRAFGEPSIGVDTRNDNVMYQAGLYTIKAHFGSGSHPQATFAEVSDKPLTSSFSEDAILFVDRFTGRTWVSQLDAACSISAYSDNDGKTWTPAAKGCQTPPAVDHQTIGAGPFAKPIPSGATYPDAVYYCSQNVAYAACGLSLDGGNTYGAASPMFNSSECFGLHGHVKVAPDGAVYVPNKACGAPECIVNSTTAGPHCHPGYAVSTDNGATWTVHNTGGHTRLFNTGDPSIGIGSRGTMYFGFGGRDGRPYVTVCKHDGATCARPKPVGWRFHIRNTEMAEVVAGDDDRAAFAFLGSTTPGDDQQYAFRGTWHLYVATTYDGGKHWATVDATPSHPMQRGCIEFDGDCPSDRGSNDQRNLLDFNDLTIDREGRILVAYTDGCYPDLGPPPKHGTCRQDARRLSGLNPEIEGPAISRQWCGLGLYRRFDKLMKPCP
jgi:hypothetical protein